MGSGVCNCGGVHQVTIDCDLAEQLRTLLPRVTDALDRVEHPTAQKLGLSKTQAAELLGVSVRTIEGLVDRGEIRVRHFGTRVVIPRRELDRVLDVTSKPASIGKAS